MLKPIVKAVIVALGILAANDVFATKLRFPQSNAPLVTNANGDHLYFVLLRADFVRELGDAGEAQPIPPSEMRPTDDPRAWHRADARKMVRSLEGDYNFSAISMTSWIAPSLKAYLSERQLAALDADPRVDTIELMEAAGTTFSASPPWDDYTTAGGEGVSYGKVAMDMDDNVTPSATVYMLDAGLGTNGLSHVDLSGGFVTNFNINGITNCDSEETHASSVAGILSATHGNSAGIKGVNNAGTILSVSKYCDYTYATHWIGQWPIWNRRELLG